MQKRTPMIVICCFDIVCIHCIVDTDECVSNPCFNGGTCENLDELICIVCIVDECVINIVCIVDTDECVSNPCFNGGTCENLEGSYRCICPKGYTGTRCEGSK